MRLVCGSSNEKRSDARPRKGVSHEKISQEEDFQQSLCVYPLVSEKSHRLFDEILLFQGLR